MLTQKQKEQVVKQLALHTSERRNVHLLFRGKEVMMLSDFLIEPFVFRPDIMASSRVLAQFLADNTHLYKGKIALDMGCGTGVQGIVMGRYARVIFTDIYQPAILNAVENVSHFFFVTGNPCPFGLERELLLDQGLFHYYFFSGDLFDSQTVTGDVNLRRLLHFFDVIVFNHPFFPAPSDIHKNPPTIAMLDDGNLLQRFLAQAKVHLKRDGIIIMPFLHMAGDTNNPAVQAPPHGYKIEEVFATTITEGVQQGPFSIYLLSIR